MHFHSSYIYVLWVSTVLSVEDIPQAVFFVICMYFAGASVPYCVLSHNVPNYIIFTVFANDF